MRLRPDALARRAIPANFVVARGAIGLPPSFAAVLHGSTAEMELFSPDLDWARKFFSAHTGIEAGIKIFRKELSMRRRDHFVVWCRDFKDRQSPQGERSPKRCLPLRIACATEHLDLSRIRLGDVFAAYPNFKPLVVIVPALVRDRTA